MNTNVYEIQNIFLYRYIQFIKLVYFIFSSLTDEQSDEDDDEGGWQVIDGHTSATHLRDF